MRLEAECDLVARLGSAKEVLLIRFFQTHLFFGDSFKLNAGSFINLPADYSVLPTFLWWPINAQ